MVGTRSPATRKNASASPSRAKTTAPPAPARPAPERRKLSVYPDAYPLHDVSAAVLLFLMAKGGGAVSLDDWITRRWH
jgi:hypothetical protein